ncbi:hypothetical protein BKA01_006956 [Pseudonocardia eucalypti]|nr:hypothetical protein [Pseudonocardia eucalypti]
MGDIVGYGLVNVRNALVYPRQESGINISHTARLCSGRDLCRGEIRKSARRILVSC